MKQSGGWDDLASSTLGHCSALCCPPKRVCVVLNVQGSDLWVHPLPWNFLRGMWLWPAISTQAPVCVAYILKVKKSADSTFQSPKICGKSA